MELTSTKHNQRIHPHKFTLWIAIASICMMFAGLTSAYIVKSNQDNFLEISLPNYFWYSTIAIVLSSITIHLATKAFKARERNKYKLLISLTAFLGIVFASLQVMGFVNIENHGISLIGNNSNAAASFLLVIIGLHALHVLGGVIALLVMFILSFSQKIKSYNSIPIENVSIYWHFVDILWIYLLIFLIWIR
ncbi:MAG: cytochrome c oxidase subunit 3 [Chitinophagaceae bacterium]|nr:cytochrome c oxidase subunit 3 [Chitinophagaceae bacterium]MCW5906196.1 cytochrome c oxidase subunit 3 [Chitinophagaceae bacterium]